MRAEKRSVRAELSGGGMSPDAITARVQMQMRELADGYPARDCLKSVLARIARRAGLTMGQVKRLYYGEWRRIPADVFLKVEEAHRNHLQDVMRQAEHKAEIYRKLKAEWESKCPEFSSFTGSYGSAPVQALACAKPCTSGKNPSDKADVQTSLLPGFDR